MSKYATPEQRLALAQDVLALLESNSQPECPDQKIEALILALTALTSGAYVIDLLGARSR